MPLDKLTRDSLGFGQCLDMDEQPLTTIEPELEHEGEWRDPDLDFQTWIWATAMGEEVLRGAA